MSNERFSKCFEGGRVSTLMTEVEWVIFPPDEMGVPSMTNNGIGMFLSFVGILCCEIKDELIKLPVAPLSIIARVKKENWFKKKRSRINICDACFRVVDEIEAYG